MAGPSGPREQVLVDRVDAQRIGIHGHHGEVGLVSADNTRLQTGRGRVAGRVQTPDEADPHPCRRSFGSQTRRVAAVKPIKNVCAMPSFVGTERRLLWLSRLHWVLTHYSFAHVDRPEAARDPVHQFG